MANTPSDDSFGDIVPQSAIILPSAVNYDYVTEGLDPSGTQTRIAEPRNSKEG
jgi:hypothetical protein